MFLIFVFPIVYLILSKKRYGLLYLAIISLVYEVMVYCFPLKVSLYRVIGMRYLFLLALGAWTFLNPKIRIKTSSLIGSVFLGGIYILLYKLEGTNVEIFPYGTWGNTSYFVFLYIYPIFYLLIKYGKNFVIRNRMLDCVLSKIGENTYYILLVQMVMFWGINRLYAMIAIPLAIQIVVNITIACLGGIVCGHAYEWILNKSKFM